MHPWILRTALLFGLLGALWISTPSIAYAKPFPTSPGPELEGDPTADDQPSPTPKPKGNQMRVATAPSVKRGTVTIVRIPLEVYLRLLVSFRAW